VENQVLSISAERRADHAEGDQVLLQERFDGAISRKLRVPDWVDADAVTADYTDGVLTVRLPVADKAKARRIQIQGGSAQPASIES
jgi:HSP20 family protein